VILVTSTKLDPSFVVAAIPIGSDAFDQDLSERRADTIKRYPVQDYGIANNDLVRVGYGKTKLKNKQDRADPISGRVQVVNQEAKTASK
jgi:outer membrane protein OmpA-like peptidoglycan-associated protein